MTRFTRSLTATILLAVPAITPAQETVAVKQSARPAIYDAKADAKDQVKVATDLARRDSRRVLVMFGFNNCGWCHKLHGLYKSDPAIRQLLADEYVLAMIDIQSPNADSLLDASKAALSPEELKKGVGFPFLAVLDGDGRVLTAQRTDPLEVGDHHDPAKVKGFLEKWTATKVAASQALEGALAKASAEDKLVFLHFGSPTCGWCHKLEGFLARVDMAPLFGRDFVDLKIDIDRMTGGEDVLLKYNAGKSGGVPWFVFLDPSGKAIADSNGPKGNVGYPVMPEEIEHFMGMLKKSGRKIEPADLEKIEAALKADAKKIEEEMAARNAKPVADR